jgi:hypothetical protein
MKQTISIDQVQELKAQLTQVRQQSLAASRLNDFRTVARLTNEAARLNRAIHAQDDFAGSPGKSMALVEALRQFDDAGKFEFPQVATLPGAEAGRAELEEAA